MLRACLLLVVILGVASSALADSTETASIGGGVKNPWRSPYKTAATATVQMPRQ